VAGRESEFSGMNRGNKILVRRALVTRRVRRPRVFASTAGEFPRNSRTKLAQETRLRRPLRVFRVNGTALRTQDTGRMVSGAGDGLASYLRASGSTRPCHQPSEGGTWTLRRPILLPLVGGALDDRRRVSFLFFLFF